MGRIGVLMGFLGVPLINGRWIGVLRGLWGSDRGFDGGLMGLCGVNRGFDGVLMGFLGVPLINGGGIGGF